uniref:Uncharacterized protein n=1 Tax=Rhizophora mucronata TaxID=61149 RepID=A0A2P2PNS6_RHIMU
MDHKTHSHALQRKCFKIDITLLVKALEEQKGKTKFTFPKP